MHNNSIFLFVILLSILLFFRYLYYFTININKEKVLILGANDIARSVARELKNGCSRRFEVQGFIAESIEDPYEILDYHVLGNIKELAKIVEERKPSVVVVALSERRGLFPYKEILDCKLQGIRVEDWPTFY